MRKRLPVYRAVEDDGWYKIVETRYVLPSDFGDGWNSQTLIAVHRVVVSGFVHATALKLVAALTRDQQNQKDFGKNGPYIGFPTLV